LIEYVLIALYLLSCFVLILFVLLQPGKSDAAAVFGGGASSTAFGPRGTQTVMAKITVGAAIVFFLIAFLFSIPGLIGKKSLGRSLGTQSQPSAPAPVPAVPPPGSSDQPSALPTPEASPAASATPAAGKPATGATPAAADKSPAKKK